MEELSVDYGMLNVSLYPESPSAFSNNTYLGRPEDSKRWCFLTFLLVTRDEFLNPELQSQRCRNR